MEERHYYNFGHKLSTCGLLHLPCAFGLIRIGKTKTSQEDEAEGTNASTALVHSLSNTTRQKQPNTNSIFHCSTSF